MTEAPDWIITPEQLQREMRDVVLVDVREPEENAEARIEGSKLIPLDDLSQRAPGELERGADIVVYCAHGVRSMHGAMALRMLGFRKIRSLEGGIAAWMEAGFPILR